MFLDRDTTTCFWFTNRVFCFCFSLSRRMSRQCNITLRCKAHPLTRRSRGQSHPDTSDVHGHISHRRYPQLSPTPNIKRARAADGARCRKVSQSPGHARFGPGVAEDGVLSVSWEDFTIVFSLSLLLRASCSNVTPGPPC